MRFLGLAPTLVFTLVFAAFGIHATYRGTGDAATAREGKIVVELDWDQVPDFVRMVRIVAENGTRPPVSVEKIRPDIAVVERIEWTVPHGRYRISGDGLLHPTEGLTAAIFGSDVQVSQEDSTVIPDWLARDVDIELVGPPEGMYVGQEIPLRAEVVLDAGRPGVQLEGTVQWTSSHPEVAKIEGDSVVGLRSGTVTIAGKLKGTDIVSSAPVSVFGRHQFLPRITPPDKTAEQFLFFTKAEGDSQYAHRLTLTGKAATPVRLPLEGNMPVVVLPNGKLLFASNRKAEFRVFAADPDGESWQPVYLHAEPIWEMVASPDGKTLLLACGSLSEKGIVHDPRRLYLLPVDGSGPATYVAQEPSETHLASGIALSNDGRIAYEIVMPPERAEEALFSNRIVVQQLGDSPVGIKDAKPTKAVGQLIGWDAKGNLHFLDKDTRSVMRLDGGKGNPVTVSPPLEEQSLEVLAASASGAVVVQETNKRDLYLFTGKGDWKKLPEQGTFPAALLHR